MKTMKKQIRLMLNYNCYPIWIYDEHNAFIDNDIVSEITDNPTLCNLLEELQHDFDSLYLNNNREFKYIGFHSEKDKNLFIKKIKTIYNLLLSNLGNKYRITNEIDFKKL